MVLQERDNCLLAAVAIAKGLSTIIGGKSRTGKSMIMNRIFAFIPYYDMAGTSKRAVVDIITEINRNMFAFGERNIVEIN